MVVQALKKYLKKHSDFISLNEASYYTPNLHSVEKNTIQLTCKEFDGSTLNIQVVFGIQSVQNSSCSCSENTLTICKHQIAGLNKIIDLIVKRQLSNDFYEYLPNSRDTSIPVINGTIIISEFNKITFSTKTYYYSPYEIKSLNRTQVIYSFYDLGRYLDIELIYAFENDQLTAKCSCKSVNPCHHKLIVIEHFIRKFGVDYFSSDYIDRIKKGILLDKKLPEQILFDDIFTLEITKEGIKYAEKLTNLVSPGTSALGAFKLDELENIILPKNRDNYGVALCFETVRKNIGSVFPFMGKLNKDGNELASKFKRIEFDNLHVNQEFLDNPKDFDFLVAACSFENDFRYVNWMKWDKMRFEKMISLFSPFIRNFGQDYPIYKYDASDTFVKKNLTQLRLVTGAPKPIVRIEEKEKFVNIQMKLRINGQLFGINSSKFTITPFGLIFGNELHTFENATTALLFVRAMTYQELNIIKTPEINIRAQFIDPLSKFFEVEYSGLKAKKKNTKVETFEKHLYLSDEESEYIVLRPLVNYGEQLLTPCSQEKIWASSSGLEYFERKHEEEQEFLEDIRKLHPSFQDMGNYFYIHAEKALEKLWLMGAIETLQEQNVKIFGLNNLKRIPYNLNKASFSVLLSSNTDWFDMKIDVSYGDQKVDLRDLQKAIVKKQNYVELKDGTLGLLPQEWIEKYKKYFKLGQVKKDQLEISNYQFSIIDELFEEMNAAPTFLQELYEKKKRLTNLKQITNTPKPKGLKAELRPYQQDGLNWLVFLEENQLGGCLADDMGLGKTLQTIAFLQHLKNKHPKKQLTHLVIAPTSLIFNWQAELKKFAPSLNVLAFIGANREENKDEIMNYDVVLSTYGSLINDVTLHQKNEYHYVILDESQAIKNPESQRYKAVRLLKSKNRLVLTGTPIENNTFDLYSQFNFINPGFFGSVKHFRTTFSDAIDRDQDQDTSLLLAKMINPFLLRRTKSQVATELPPKIEGFVYCEMGAEQRKVYEHFKQYFREQIQKQIEEEGINKSQMYILQGLTKLRQICNSTELADTERDFGSHSAKLDELVRHLKEKVTKHKVLIFSQFVGMLQIIQRRLEKENINFEYLDGQTRKREEKVNSFQSDESIRVFLISLKAGGTGLNLTEADYVYLIDPWWNPAVENQAIDRCYRIGQNKTVMAYRMICTNSIEEKIVQLQEKKKNVASEVIRIDMDKKSFNLKEVEHLFA